jgi:hypothetical protein
MHLHLSPRFARLPAAALAAALTFCTAAALAAPAAQNGVKWRVTTSMSMQGMTIPAQSAEVCQPLNSDQTAMMSRDQDHNCTITNHRRTGNTESFDMRCTGEQDMQGRMEITHLGPDHYRGRMRATSKEGTFDMNYEGQKLGGSCDAGAVERQARAAVAQSQAQVAAMCRQAAASGDPTMFVGEGAICTAAADKTALCKTVKDYDGFGRLLDGRRAAAQTPNGASFDNSGAVARLCGIQIDAQQQKLCTGAQAARKMAFLCANCPALADPIGQRECVGRGYTTPVAAPYRDFCSAWASTTAGAAATGTADAQSGEDARSPTERGRDAVREGAEALRGILGF